MRRLLFATTLAIALPMAAHACILPGNADALRAEVITVINAERASAGLPALRPNTTLQKAAQGHACDNASRRSISHDGADGSTLGVRLKRAGYRYRAAAENTGRGFANGARAVAWWMDSPRHKANILMGNIQEVGIGVAVSAAPDSRLHWIVNVGARR